MSAELAPITFVLPSPCGDALPVRALLADAAETLAAYDHHAAVLLGEPYEPRRIAWTEPGDAMETPLAVVGVTPDEGGEDEVRRLDEATGLRSPNPSCKASRLTFPAGALVYGAYATCAASQGTEGKLANDSLAELRDACERSGASWGGGLLVDYGHLSCEHVAELPRMGILRRPISEAIDQLIAALRSSLTLPEAAQTFGYEGELAKQAARSILKASQPLPKPLCALIAALR